LNKYLQRKIEITRIRVGKKQEIETLINEEALLLSMYLRDEKRDWIPRTGVISIIASDLRERPFKRRTLM